MFNIRNEVHDMSNILMMLVAHYKRGKIEAVGNDIDMLIKVFEVLKKHSYRRIKEEMVIVSMKDRMEVLGPLLHGLEQTFDIRINVDSEACNSTVQWYTVDNMAQVALSNIIQNAAKAGATNVWITLIAKTKTVELIFRDNGRGMNEEELENLGFNTDIDLGHGVWIIRDAVNAARGVCCWKSLPNLGTELKIILKRYYESTSDCNTINCTT